MKKLFAFAILVAASSFALANDLTLAHYNKPAIAVAETSAATSKTTENTSAPSALESGASKAGAIIGGMLKAPAVLGKAFASGVSAGYSGASAPMPASAKIAVQKQDVASSPESATATGFRNPLAKLSGMLQRSKGQANAAIEDHSVLASSTNYRSVR